MSKLGALLAALVLTTVNLAGAAAAPALLQAHYECLWWSPDQFHGFDPNNPPEKKTVTTLTRWEYSDPVSVPHPDTVSLVVAVAPGTAAPSLRLRWLTRTGWIDPQTKPPTRVRSGTAEPPTYRFEIPVEAAVARYHPSKLRAIITAERHRLGQADLPFQLGD